MQRETLKQIVESKEVTTVETLRYTLNYQASEIFKELVFKVSFKGKDKVRIDLGKHGVFLVEKELAKYLLELLGLLSSLLSRENIVRELSVGSITLAVPKLFKDKLKKQLRIKLL